MSMPKIIALDLDGTLLDSRKNFPAEFPEWVRSHPETAFVLASGRQIYALLDQFSEIKDMLWYIAENGACVYHAGEFLCVDSMKPEDSLKILEEFEGVPGCEPLVCGLKSAYVRDCGGQAKEESTKYYTHIEYNDDLRSCALKDRILKIAIFVNGFRAEEVYTSLPPRKDGLLTLLSGDSWIDIANASIGKGAALRAIQGILGASPEETAAFGDYLNDMSLFEAAAESYAMANAHPELKDAAKHITRYTNDENGVMEALKEMENENT